MSESAGRRRLVVRKNGRSAVTGRWAITDTDVRAMLRLAQPAKPAADDIFYGDVLIGLRELIPCTDITFQLMDVAKHRGAQLFVDDNGVHRAERDGMGDEFTRLFWQEFWSEVGGVASVVTGDHFTLRHHAETSRTRAYANTPLGSAYAALGWRDDIVVPMTPLDGADRRLMLWRSQEMPDFSEREVAMLALLRPHLAELHARRDRELRGVPRLTPRQWEVLRQVATGAGNARIARSLGVSEATVGKHLENIFFRLGVQSRTEAVATARQRGLL